MDHLESILLHMINFDDWIPFPMPNHLLYVGNIRVLAEFSKNKSQKRKIEIEMNETME